MKRLMKRITLHCSLMPILIAILLLMGAAPAAGDTTTWTGGTGSWFTDSYWDNHVPTASTDAFINNGGTAIIASGDATAQSLMIADNSTSTGTVTQNGGTLTLSAGVNSMMIGLTSTASGNYNLLGGSLYTQHVVVGDSGQGEFWQSGDNTIHQVGQVLTLGQTAGGVGEYTLTGGTLQTNHTTVGDAGTGTFTQTGGTHNATTGVTLGQNTSAQGTGTGYTGQGTYNLEGGDLVAQVVSVDNGEFLQKFGTTNTELQSLIVNAVGGEAKYTLQGGTLTTVTERIGGLGSGTFTQTGGDHKVTGTDLGQGLMVGGGPTCYFNLEGGTLEAYNVGVGPGEFRQLEGTTNTIGNLMVSTTVESLSKYTLDGGDLITQNVTVGSLGHGEFLQNPGSTHNVTKGMNIGNLAPGEGQYTLAGGALSFASKAYLTMGNQGVGTFTQNGGEVTWGASTLPTINTLTLGQNFGSGTYNLQGETASLHMDGMEIVGGYQGTGTFMQSGGTNEITSTGGGDYGRLLVGNMGSSQGRYELSGGLLTVDGNEIVGGNGGQGTFIHSGGTNDITKTLAGADGGRLLIGWNNSVGRYELSNGLLKVDGKEMLGGPGGNGTFIQSGGTNIMTGTYVNDGAGRLVVGWYDNSVGTYTLSAGEFTADRIVLGDTDIGTPDQSLASGQGTLNITGPGNLVVKELFVGLAADKGNGGFGKLYLASQDAYVEVSQTLEIGPIGIFTAVPGAVIHMTGSDYVNSSTTPGNMTGLENLKMIFTGGPGVTDTFEVGFDLYTLEIGPNSRVQLVDFFDNITINGILGDEGLHVASLILGEGAILDRYGLNLTYDSLTGNTSQIVSTPIPGSLLLLGTGLLGLGALGWRRRQG